MAKRGATTELNHENWSKEDEPEEMGSFRKASSEQLAGRQIKKARRRGVVGESPTAGGGGLFKGFGSFTGFGGTTESSSQPTFSFLNNTSQNESQTKPFDFLSNSKSTTKTEISSKIEFSSKTNSSIFESAKTNGVEESKINQEPSKSRSKLFLAQLKALNEGVLSWVKQHLDKNPHVNLTPVFDDYKKHFEGLSKKYPLESEDPDSESEALPAAKDDKGSEKENKPVDQKDTSKENSNDKPFSFPVSPASTGSTQKSTDTKLPLFSFGGSSTSGKDKDKENSEFISKPLFSFGSVKADAKKPDFTFGSTESSNKGFSFGNLSATQTSLSSSTGSSFSFSGVSQASSGGSSDVKSTAEADEPKDEPPEVVVKEVKEEDAVYEKKCKLFYMKDDTYVERGLGTLFLKPAGEKTQLLVRAFTNLGNVLLNIVLNSSIPCVRAGKNGVIIACVPNPPLDPKEKEPSTKPVKMLIRVKTSEDADNLLEKINELKK